MRDAAPSSRSAFHCVRAALCLAILLALPGGAQNGPPQQRPSIGEPSRDRDVQFESADPVLDEHRLQALNSDRQKSLVSDTNKLLKIAADLDAEIGRTNPETLSSSQLRKVAEIEKLARGVKEKMSTSVRGAPAFRQPPVPMPH
jgi:predicted outer membrane protein